MNIITTPIQGLFKIPFVKNADSRGNGAKFLPNNLLRENGIAFTIDELFYSFSEKNVIRGMHMQTSPYQQKKVVSLLQGEILDVVVDLRNNSLTYKQFEMFRIDEKSNFVLFIPEGCAHGFCSLKENTIVVYGIEGVYDKDHDKGLHYKSFGFDWGIANPIVSAKDENLPELSKFCEYLKEKKYEE